MVSGETIVRNLQHGLAPRRRRWAARRDARRATCPTCSGTSRRCRSCCALAGLEHAVVWRGVPSGGRRRPRSGGARPTARRCAPSTSTARTRTGATSRTIPTQLVARARGYDAELGDAALPGGGMLLMNGSDHLLPQPWFGRVVAAANDAQAEYRFTVTSLAEYLRGQPVDGLRDVVRRAALRRPRQRAHGRGVEPRRRAPGCGAAPSAASSACAEPLSALLLAPDDVPGRAARHRLAAAGAQQRARLVVRVQRRRGRRRGAGALPGGAPRRRGAHRARRCRRSRRPIDAPPASTIVVNSTARDPRRHGQRARARRRARCTWWRSTTAPRARRRSSRDHGGEGISTVVVGQKIRWVLEMMRGPELAGARIARVERRHARRRHRSSSPSTTPRPASPSRPRSHARPSCSRWARRARRSRSASGARPCARSWSPTDRGPGLRLAHLPRGRRARARRRPCAPRTGTLANEHLRVEVDPADGTLTIDGRRRAPSRARTATSTVATAATPTTTHRPRSTPSSTGPTRSTITRGRVGPGAGAAASSPPRYELARRRDRRRTVVHRAAATTGVPIDVATTLELRTGERFLRVHVELDHRRARPPPACALPPARDRSTAPTPSARSRSCTAGLTAEGGPHEYGLPTFVSRRFVDCSGRRAPASRCSTTGCSSTRSSTTAARARAHPAAGHRLPVALRAALRPNPAGPLDPLDGPQLQGRSRWTTPCSPTGATGATRRSPTRPTTFLVPLERVRGGGWTRRRRRARPAARCGSTGAGRRRCRATTPARSSCGS